MRGISITLIFAFALLAVAPRLFAKDRMPAVDSPQFREVRTSTPLPKSIIALCADEHGRLAEPGQNWQATDVVVGKSLPTRRLIWAAIADGVYIIHYESGGIAINYHVLLATLDPGASKPRVVWRAIGASPLKDYHDLGPALRNGKLNMQNNDR
jgi:hypothetical protein